VGNLTALLDKREVLKGKGVAAVGGDLLSGRTIFLRWGEGDAVLAQC